MVAHRLTSVLLAITIVFVVMTIAATTLGSERTVIFEATAPLNEKLLPAGVFPTSEQRTAMVVEKPTDRERRLKLFIDLVPLLLALPVLWLLRGIARSVRDGDPFGQVNVRRLRAIGVLLIVGIPAAHYIGQALQRALAEPYMRSPFESVTTRGLLPPDDDFFPWTALLSGLGAFVLAQVFAHGVRLREDVESTI
jgi:hypothetical protein